MGALGAVGFNLQKPEVEKDEVKGLNRSSIFSHSLLLIFHSRALLSFFKNLKLLEETKNPVNVQSRLGVALTEKKEEGRPSAGCTNP